ncbi:MAG TPA: A/G-specific adenine glycosylase [Gammaproteobacteria bacterium]|nr:A/G-specific adenine glycosylase [Gammaproteobacteria bacterium]
MAHDRSFAARLLRWHHHHGRHDLPWQHTGDPYRVWLSEIMLQQTQVATVIPYYQRFVKRLPDIHMLAMAPLDEVLKLWAGLGYYARARHLHRCAQFIAQEQGGRWPRDLETLRGLPGIGRSTAGAILALAHGLRHPILDGNVKRVLTRHHAVRGFPGDSKIEQKLWRLAERHLPRRNIADYTQAIMDLGATVCTRRRPDCPRCPLRADCRAYLAGNPEAYPAPRPKRSPPVKSARFLILRDAQNRVWLQRRPAVGIWGGLWSFPEIAGPENEIRWCRKHLGVETAPEGTLPPFRHRFTHFHLDIHAECRRVTRRSRAMTTRGGIWYNNNDELPVGVAAPIKRLLAAL